DLPLTTLIGVTRGRNILTYTQTVYNKSKEIAVDLGNNIISLDEAQTQPWIELAKPIAGEWVAKMDGMGADGQALFDEAQSLMASCGADMASIDTYGSH
ncbi:MAG: hypothetical protein P8X69_10780, partial [Maritimibacter sp.]